MTDAITKVIPNNAISAISSGAAESGSLKYQQIGNSRMEELIVGSVAGVSGKRRNINMTTTIVKVIHSASRSPIRPDSPKDPYTMTKVPPSTPTQASAKPKLTRWPNNNQANTPARTGAVDQISITLAIEVSLRAKMKVAVLQA